MHFFFKQLYTDVIVDSGTWTFDCIKSNAAPLEKLLVDHDDRPSVKVIEDVDALNTGFSCRATGD